MATITWDSTPISTSEVWYTINTSGTNWGWTADQIVINYDDIRPQGAPLRSLSTDAADLSPDYLFRREYPVAFPGKSKAEKHLEAF